MLLLKPIFLRITKHLFKGGWKGALLVLGILFVFTWIGVWIFEPAEKGIANPSNFWWYFMVSIYTVGYGDYFPVSVGGRIFSAMIFVGGIAAASMLVASFQNWKGRKMKGLTAFNEQGHAVVLGYSSGRTERLVSELTQGGYANETVIICAHLDQVSEHPMHEQDRVKFVRGVLNSDDVLIRACVASADRVIIEDKDDNATLMLALAVDGIKPTGHVVVVLRDIERTNQLKLISNGFEGVPYGSLALIVDAAQDPGVSQLYNALQSNTDKDCSMYRVDSPEGWPGCTFGQLRSYFDERLAATVVAVRRGKALTDPIEANLRGSSLVKGAEAVYYLASSRLDIPWTQLG